MFYFCTSSQQCFCTTLGNTKHENWVFFMHAVFCMLFCQQTHTRQKYHLVTAKPPFTVKMIDCMHQTRPRKGAQHPAVRYPHARHLPVCHDVGHCVKNAVVLHQAWSESQWTVLLVGWLEFNAPFQHKYGHIKDKTVLLRHLIILTNVRCYQKRC